MMGPKVTKGSGGRPLELASLDGGVVRVPPEALAALAARVEGELLRPGDPGFREATTIWNGMIRKTPALVVRPTGARDVAAVVDFAREHRVLLSVKGGGHHIAGTALADGGVTLEMSRLRGVEVDAAARTARVGAGCLLQDVDRATQAHGLATPLGFVSDTGVAGLTLGGGIGYLARRFGYTVDNLLEVEVVTADGEVRRASREIHPDLFWALRGGGGNVGVVTEFVYRLHPVGPEIVGGVLLYPAETRDEAEAALAAYRDLAEAAPRELTVFCVLRRAPPAPFVPEPWQGRRVALFLVCHSGDPATARRDLAPLEKALGPPIVDAVARRPYVEQQSLIDGAEPHGMHYYWKTEYLAGLADGVLEVARDLSLENPFPGAEVGILHLGGAIADRAADDGAVGNRGVRFAMGVNAMWPPDEPVGDRVRAWVRDGWSRVRPFGMGRTYVNFQGEDDGDDAIRATYGANYARLADAKARYDPTNLFRSNRNVPPGLAGRVRDP